MSSQRLAVATMMLEPGLRICEAGHMYKQVDCYILKSHTVVILTDGTTFYWAKTSTSEPLTKLGYDLDPEDFRDRMNPIPIENIFPPIQSNLTAFSSEDYESDSSYYIQHPILVHYPEWTYQPGYRISDILLREAQICELLLRNPHPNVAKYRGFITFPHTTGARIYGLAFRGYEKSLADEINSGFALVGNKDDCLHGIQEGIKHLHKLGLAHNHIHPKTIMLESDGTPVIADFTTCAVRGHRIPDEFLFTPEYAEFCSEVSSVWNDFEGFKIIKKFLSESSDM
jgi:hypothetical protein